MGERTGSTVKIVFTYDVPVDRQPEYLNLTRDKIKPFWESHGCQSYSLWQPIDSPTAFVKEMVFEDRAAMEKTMALDEAKPVKELFQNFAQGVSRKVCIYKI